MWRRAETGTASRERVRCVCVCVLEGRADRNGAALAHERDDGVVAAGAAGGRVDDEEDGLVLDEREGRGREHVGDVAFSEDLLERVKREAGELGFYEVGAVLRAKKYMTQMLASRYIRLR